MVELRQAEKEVNWLTMQKLVNLEQPLGALKS